MKFGKRRKESAAPDASDDVPAAPPPVTDSWTVPAPDQQGAYEQPAPAAYEEPAPVAYEEPAPVAYEEPAVEGEAVELPIEHVPAQAYEQPVPLTMRQPAAAAAMPFPVAEEPVAVVTPGEPVHVSSLGDAGEAYASGHAAAPGPNWQEPVMAMANERPELVVGAAFAGGILAAMILRRLGN